MNINITANKAKISQMWTIPNILTLSRIVAIPVLMVAFYMEQPLGGWIAGIVFAFAGITDFFDGYLARASGTVSKIGKFLDPIADKLMVGAVIILVVAFDIVDGLHIIAAVIIMCRELLVSGLREFLASEQIDVPVSVVAKWKTAFQMIALGVLCWAPAGDALGFHATEIGITTLWFSAMLTLYTGYDYLRAGLKHMV